MLHGPTIRLDWILTQKYHFLAALEAVDNSVSIISTDNFMNNADRIMIFPIRKCPILQDAVSWGFDKRFVEPGMRVPLSRPGKQDGIKVE